MATPFGAPSSIDYNMCGHVGAHDARCREASTEVHPDYGEAWECNDPGPCGVIIAAGKTSCTLTQSVAGRSSVFRLIIRSVVLPVATAQLVWSELWRRSPARSATRYFRVSCDLQRDVHRGFEFAHT